MSRENGKLKMGVINSVREIRNAATVTIHEPSARDVLRSLTKGELGALKSVLVDDYGKKGETVNRYFERHRVPSGSAKQTRGAVKGVTGDYADALREKFPEKFKGTEETVYPEAEVEFDGDIQVSNESYKYQLRIPLSADDAGLLAGSADREEALDNFLSVYWRERDANEIPAQVTRVRKFKINF